MPELIAVVVIVRIVIVAVRSDETDRKPPEVMTMMEEMAMVQTGDMHSSWRKGTDSRWTRSTESRWTRSTDSRWRRSAEMLAAHGGTTALKTTAAEAAATVKAATAVATAEATTAVAAATAEATTAVATATGEAATAVATAEATTAVAAATGEAATAVATAAAATAATAAASPCNSTGRGEGDANCRYSGKKKSDLSGHGTTPRIRIAPRKFNTTHAKLFRSRNVSLGSLLFPKIARSPRSAAPIQPAGKRLCSPYRFDRRRRLHSLSGAEAEASFFRRFGGGRRPGEPETRTVRLSEDGSSVQDAISTNTRFCADRTANCSTSRR
jgi:hypothetical protein